MTDPIVNELTWKPRRGAIIGVGLLGTSVALGLRQLWPDMRLVGVARRETTRRAALDVGAVHEVTDQLRAAAQNADLVIVGTPVDCIAAHVREAAEVCAEHALITDVGSTKAKLVACIESDARAARHFVGSHPLAGSEKTGPWHGRAELLRGRTVVLTPTPRTPPDLYRLCDAMWRALGAKTLQMTPDEHDAALAATSHLPHLVAAALAAITQPNRRTLVGSGWRDTTRIAGGDPALWRAILEANCDHVLQELDRMQECLKRYRDALSQSQFDQVQKLLSLGKEVRDQLS